MFLCCNSFSPLFISIARRRECHTDLIVFGDNKVCAAGRRGGEKERKRDVAKIAMVVGAENETNSMKCATTTMMMTTK